MANAVPIRLNPDVYSSNGKTISDKFFGGNILFDRDKVGGEGTFDEKVSALNINFIRYPGGGVSELYFSLKNPNRTIEFDGYSGRLMPLNEFSDFAKANGYDYALVVPTVNYMEALHDGSMTIGEIRSELRTFLSELKSGSLGADVPSVFEIGNEYYVIKGLSYQLEADLYGTIAKVFATEIRSFFGASVEIAVQAGINNISNNTILGHFQGAGHLVDAVVIHSYPWTLSEVRDQTEAKLALANAWKDLGVAEHIFASEWNISDQRLWADGTVIDASLQERGMAHAVAMVEMMGSYLQAGIDFAAVWPLQQRTATDLAGNEGETSDNNTDLSDRNLSLAGEAFRLMSTSVVGTRSIETADIDIDGKQETARYRDEILVQAFEDANKLVVFVSAWALKDHQLGTKFQLDIPGAFEGATVTRLNVGSSDVTNPRAKPVIEEMVDHQVSSANDILLSLDHKYEIVRIVFEKVEGMTLFGTSGRDRLTGATGDDSIFGSAQNDTLIGNSGSDYLIGGIGSDFILAGSGADVINGGNGNDRVSAGANNDVIRGGNGNDRVSAGANNDVVLGGNGNDTLFGSGGDDLIRSGKGNDMLYGNGGDDRLLGFRGNETLSGGVGDDTISGNAGNDRIIGGLGDDRLLGGLGRDTFVFSEKGFGTDRIVGGFRVGTDMIDFSSHRAVDNIDDLWIREISGSTIVSVRGENSKIIIAGFDDLIGHEHDVFLF